jgi:glycosyltransferase involved in cell wall biosynthesis
MTVRFSVLIPTYNREKLIRQTIDSVLSQSFMDYEVIVVDDGSTDRTPQLLESYGTRIQHYRQQNQGVEVARNKAASLAQGEYLCMLDDDDVFLPCTLATYEQVIRHCDGPPLIVGALAFFEDGKPVPVNAPAGAPIKLFQYPDFFAKDRPYFYTNSRIVMRRSVFDQIGGYGYAGERMFLPIEDLTLLFKAGRYGPCVIVHEPYTVARREHATNAIRNLAATADGILDLVRMDKLGRFSGGWHQRLGRYAVIGGLAWWWAFRHCWPEKQRKVALRLFFGAAPMIAVKRVTRLMQYFRKLSPPIFLPPLELPQVGDVEQVSDQAASG